MHELKQREDHFFPWSRICNLLLSVPSLFALPTQEQAGKLDRWGIGLRLEEKARAWPIMLMFALDLWTLDQPLCYALFKEVWFKGAWFQGKHWEAHASLAQTSWDLLTKHTHTPRNSTQNQKPSFRQCKKFTKETNTCKYGKINYISTVELFWSVSSPEIKPQLSDAGAIGLPGGVTLYNASWLPRRLSTLWLLCWSVSCGCCREQEMNNFSTIFLLFGSSPTQIFAFMLDGFSPCDPLTQQKCLILSVYPYILHWSNTAFIMFCVEWRDCLLDPRQ